MSEFTSTAPARFATRLTFFAAGFAMACCAPLFPFIKGNVGANESQFGLLLLCLGLGSVVAMPLTGLIAARRGARPMVLLGGFGLVAILPMLPVASTAMAVGAVLFFFGASLGTLDVAMNVHGAEVEGHEKRPLMSNFHAQFSIGGFCGAGLMTLLLSSGLSTSVSACVGAIVTFVAMVLTRSRLLRVDGINPEAFTRPRGMVLLLAVLAAITFLIEGAVLDWGALLIIDREFAPTEGAGIGYILFSIAMVFARLTGDRIVGALGAFKVLVMGGVLTILGIALILLVNEPMVAIFGFVLIGLGAANLVPIIFSAAGRQKLMPSGLAVASVTTSGYAGILLGPALIGMVAQGSSLPTAFWGLAVMMTIVPLTAYKVARV
ncbi:MAG: MFS transporter [Roseobacter sp.]